MWKINRGKTSWLFLAILSVFFATLLSTQKSHAAVGINSQVSFQGKVVKGDNTNPTDGTYNMQFKIYSGGTGTGGGTLVWTENRLISGSAGVAVSSGTFQVNLGSVSTLSGVDFNDDTLWLSMQVGSTTTCSVTTTFQANCAGDGEMSPYIRFTAVPYAMNALKVGGYSASQLVQISPSTPQTGNIKISGTIDSGNLTSTGFIFARGMYANGTTGAPGAIFLKDGNSTGYNLALSLNTNALVDDLTINLPGVGATGTQCLQSTSGSTTINTTLSFAACGGGAASLQAAYTGGSTITQTAASGVTLTTGTTVPTVDQFTINNTGSTGVTTAGVNGASIKYKGGAAAIEAAGLRIDFTPGTTSGGTWSGMRIVETTGPATGVTSYGLKLEPAAATGGISTAIRVASGWDIGIDVQSGGLQLAAQADPAQPATGNLIIYAKDIAGRVMPRWISSSGEDMTFQPSLAFNRVATVLPGGSGSTCTSGTNYTATGTTFTATGGSCSAPALATTNVLTSVRRTTVNTGTAAGTVSSHRQNALMVTRGTGAGIGGFFFTTRFAASGLQTGMRVFNGLSDATAAPTNVDPLTSTANNKVGMAINASTGNWYLINNAAGTTPTTLDLGTNFAVNTTNFLELTLYSAPGGTGIGYRVRNISTNISVSGTLTTNIPANTIFMAPFSWLTNNAQAAAVTIDNAGWYLESDN